ncbi:hypothetical protein QE152_g9992 [Popillia japonica]|uniref:Transposase Helix-turn-helix domain-containing protein n=1 Tax=Popillia japonica TaxID=7064 RepID=A0AAW1LT59_POPJA
MDRQENKLLKTIIFDELANITHQLRDDCNSSSSSDDYFAEKLIFSKRRLCIKINRFDYFAEKLIFSKGRLCIKINRFAEDIVIKYSNIVFKSHFRMERSVLYNFIDTVSPHYYQSQYKPGKAQVSIEKAVLLTIWYLANTETFRQISDRFGLSYSAAYNTLLQTNFGSLWAFLQCCI